MANADMLRAPPRETSITAARRAGVSLLSILFGERREEIVEEDDRKRHWKANARRENMQLQHT